LDVNGKRRLPRKRLAGATQTPTLFERWDYDQRRIWVDKSLEKVKYMNLDGKLEPFFAKRLNSAMNMR
jgi:hypothetical protein